MIADGSPAPDTEGARTDAAFWDAQWDHRDSRALTHRLFHAKDFGPDGAFLRMMDRYVGLPAIRNAKVVELGGAASKFLVDLALHAGARVTAVDYSETGVRQTQQLFRARGIDGEAVMADMFNWHGREGEFDLAVHWGLLEHFENPDAVLRVTASVLKPGGIAVFSMPNLEAVGAHVWKYVSPDNFSKHILHSNAVVAKACVSAGLELTKTFYCGLPLVRMAPAENRGLVSAGGDLLHAAVCLLNTLRPGLFNAGFRRVSNTRGFVARKAAR